VAEVRPERATSLPIGDETVAQGSSADCLGYLRVSESSVEALATRHDFPGRKIEGEWRFLKAALNDWLRSPSPTQRLMKHAGALRDESYLDEMLEKI
jgi:hypothetical protein